MFRFETVVRYSEMDVNHCMTLPAILDMFQDCCTFQSEALGIGFSYLEQEKRAWVLLSWQVIVNRYPQMGEKITAATWPIGFQGALGNRNFLLKDERDAIIAYANSNWVFLNTENGHPARIPKEVRERYAFEPPYAMEYANRKLSIIEGKLDEQIPILVQRFHIDTNHHVNNTKYVMMAEEYLPESFKVRELRVEYKKAALLSDTIYPKTRSEEGKMVVVLENAEGIPYVIVEFLEDKV